MLQQKKYNCQTFQHFRSMIKQADLDAVVIATPTHLHKQHSQAAFEQGLDVLLEKPMALKLSQAQIIVRSAARAGCVLKVHQPHRSFAYFQRIKEIITSGKIGRIVHAKRGEFKYARATAFSVDTARIHPVNHVKYIFFLYPVIPCASIRQPPDGLVSGHRRMALYPATAGPREKLFVQFLTITVPFIRLFTVKT